VPEARDAWRDIAAKLASGLIEIEIVCTDAREHQRRVEGRRAAWMAADEARRAPRMAARDEAWHVVGHAIGDATDGAPTVDPAPPTWNDVLKRHYVPWNEDHWVIDTALWSADEAVAAICARMSAPDRAES
jgi:hypothetical protein